MPKLLKLLAPFAPCNISPIIKISNEKEAEDLSAEARSEGCRSPLAAMPPMHLLIGR